MKSVLIGILTHNHEKYIAECLQSALTQDYKCDVFVTDDASTDRTQDIIHQYHSDFPNLQYKFHTDNSGNEMRGCNEIIERSGNYDYLLRFDGDDVLYENSINTFVKHAEANSADWVYGGLDIIDANGTVVNEWTLDGFPETVPSAIAYMWNNKSLGTTLSFFSSKFLKGKRFSKFPNTTFAMDTSTAIDWYTSWPKIHRINQKLIKYRWMNGGSATSRLGDERSQMQKDLTEKMMSVFGYNNIVALLQHGGE